MLKDVFERSDPYKDLFDNAHDMIHVLEPHGAIVYVNRAWEKAMGYTEAESQGKLIYSFVSAEDKEPFVQYRQAILTGQSHAPEITIRLVTKHGDKVIVEGLVSVQVLDGNPVYTRGIFRNISRRVNNELKLKLLNEELQEREANLRQLFFYAPDAIIVIDAHSNIQYWNPKAETMFGWTQGEVLGRYLSQIIIPPQHRDAHNAGMKRYLATGEARVLNKTIEITSLHKEGREFYIALTISSTIQKGEPAFIAFIRDIDQQKRNEQELAQKKVQLELSNLELEQFAHVASHDMKEPIRKILMFTDRLKSLMDVEASEKVRLCFEKIERSARRLSKMVEGVLKNSSIKADGLVLENVHLADTITNIVTDLEFLIQEKGAIIRYSELPALEASAFLLYQLFYNLINNSLKFSKPNQQSVIEIKARKVFAPDVKWRGLDSTVPYVEIIVKDNGIGFPQEYAETIFKSFSRLHSKDKYEGTGIGLSVCKNILEKHKGFIQAFGEEDVGATFAILIPEKQG
jgi:PAS domain S-box-containing protein